MLPPAVASVPSHLPDNTAPLNCDKTTARLPPRRTPGVATPPSAATTLAPHHTPRYCLPLCWTLATGGWVNGLRRTSSKLDGMVGFWLDASRGFHAGGILPAKHQPPTPTPPNTTPPLRVFFNYHRTQPCTRLHLTARLLPTRGLCTTHWLRTRIYFTCAYPPAGRYRWFFYERCGTIPTVAVCHGRTSLFRRCYNWALLALTELPFWV